MLWNEGRAPDAGGVYIAVLGTTLLYVGQTGNLNARLWQHQNSPWYRWAVSQLGTPTWLWKLEPDARKRVADEQRLIKNRHPMLNVERRGSRSVELAKCGRRWTRRTRPPVE